MATFDKSTHRAQRTQAGSFLPVPASNNWLFMWRATDYEVATVNGVDRWVPRLSRQPLVKGVNGIRENGDASLFYAFLQSNGWNILENAARDDDPMHYADRYNARPDNTGRTTVMIDRWTDIHRVGNEVRIRRSDEQAQAFDEWRAWLIDSGRIPPVDPIIVEDICEKFYEHAVRRLMRKQQTPEVAERLEQNKAFHARMKKAHITPPKKGGRNG